MTDLTPETPDRKTPATLRTLAGAPKARQNPSTIIIHGKERVDPYAWIKDTTRSKPAVLSHIKAENRYTERVMRPFLGLEERLYQEMLGRTEQDAVSAPIERDGYFYYTRTTMADAYPIHCRKAGSLSATEEVILDENELAKGKSNHNLAAISISPDQHYLAIAINNTGTDEFELKVKDLKTGTFLSDTVPLVSEYITWGADSSTLFYSVPDETQRSASVHIHTIGTDTTTDKLLFEELDAEFVVTVERDRSKRYVIVGSESKDTTEQYLYDLQHPELGLRLFTPRKDGVQYYVIPHEDRFYVHTNANAVGFEIMETSLTATSRADWKPFIANQANTTITDIQAYKDFLVISERSNGMQQIRIRNLATQKDTYIPFQDDSYTADQKPLPMYDSKKVRFTYTSLVTPMSVYDYDVTTSRQTLIKQQLVPSGYNPDLYATKRIYATAADGTHIPISLVYKKEFAHATVKPLHVYAYGSYGHAVDPTFSGMRLSLLDRGFTFAIAHVRGGGELGEPWRLAGNLRHKKNTFTDFISCTEELVKEGYGTSGHVSMEGGSAGGLLIGAVANMAPRGLFRAGIAAVPFVDVMNTMLDDTLPLTVNEYREWGNPNNPDDYEYMESYSPYDNVEAKDYPSLLVTGGMNDPRVPFWEPTKWVAKLRHLKTDHHPLLLRIQMFGHFGESGRFGRVRDGAKDYAYLLAAHDRASTPPTPSA